jgi:hypothetical protein
VALHLRRTAGASQRDRRGSRAPVRAFGLERFHSINLTIGYSVVRDRCEQGSHAAVAASLSFAWSKAFHQHRRILIPGEIRARIERRHKFYLRSLSSTVMARCSDAFLCCVWLGLTLSSCLCWSENKCTFMHLLGNDSLRMSFSTASPKKGKG